jgi:hypothetical protein
MKNFIIRKNNFIANEKADIHTSTGTSGFQENNNKNNKKEN